jgi:uncharacterized protein YodC (DUF2158 family)
MIRFNIGDVVVQKSGGPKMTVCTSGKNVMCQWFLNGKFEFGTFAEAVLEHVETLQNEHIYAKVQK